MTYHPNPYRDGYFQSTSRGQEFVLNFDENKEFNEAIKWILAMIEI